MCIWILEDHQTHIFAECLVDSAIAEVPVGLRVRGLKKKEVNRPFFILTPFAEDAPSFYRQFEIGSA
jgi:hypothetical protein